MLPHVKAREPDPHLIAVNDCRAARCAERLAPLEFSSCTRAIARVAPDVSCGETRMPRGSIVSNHPRL